MPNPPQPDAKPEPFLVAKHNDLTVRFIPGKIIKSADDLADAITEHLARMWKRESTEE